MVSISKFVPNVVNYGAVPVNEQTTTALLHVTKHMSPSSITYDVTTPFNIEGVTSKTLPAPYLKEFGDYPTESIFYIGAEKNEAHNLIYYITYRGALGQYRLHIYNVKTGTSSSVLFATTADDLSMVVHFMYDNPTSGKTFAVFVSNKTQNQLECYIVDDAGNVTHVVPSVAYLNSGVSITSISDIKFHNKAVGAPESPTFSLIEVSGAYVDVDLSNGASGEAVITFASTAGIQASLVVNSSESVEEFTSSTAILMQDAEQQELYSVILHHDMSPVIMSLHNLYSFHEDQAVEIGVAESIYSSRIINSKRMPYIDTDLDFIRFVYKSQDNLNRLCWIDYNVEKALTADYEYGIPGAPEGENQQSHIDITYRAASAFNLEFGYYLNGVWTQTATYSLTPASARVYEEGSLVIDGDVSLGSSVRITFPGSTKALFSLTIKDNISGKTYLAIEGINNPLKAILKSSVQTSQMAPLPSSVRNVEQHIDLPGEIHFIEQTEDVDYLMVRYEGASSSEENVAIIKAEEATVMNTQVYAPQSPLSTPLTSRFYAALYNVNDDVLGYVGVVGDGVYTGGYSVDTLEKLDANLVDFGILPTAEGGYSTSVVETLTGEGVATLTAYAYALEELTEIQYGIMLFGYQHKDFHRLDILHPEPVYSTHYFYDPDYTGGEQMYDYNPATGRFEQSDTGDWRAKVVSSLQLNKSERFNRSVEFSNAYYDPYLTGDPKSKDSTVRASFILSPSALKTLISVALDSGYEVNPDAVWLPTGDEDELANLNGLDVYIGGTKQVVVLESPIDYRVARSIRFKLTAGHIEDEEDDYRIFYIQLMNTGYIGVDALGEDT